MSIRNADERCAELERAFERAEACAGAHCHFLRIAQRAVELRFAGRALSEPLLAAFEHLSVEPCEPELTICIADSESTGVTPALAAERVPGLGAAPLTGARFACDPQSGAIHCLDPVSRRAYFWLGSRSALRPWERAAPLRVLLAWWAESLGAQLAHGAVVGHAEGGILLAGAGGAGKSTLTLACLAAGLAYVGDDYVWIELGEPPCAFSLYSSIKLERAALARHFAAFLPFARESGAEKASLFLAGAPRARPLARMPLRASASLARSGQAGPRVSDTSAVSVLSALAPSSLLQIPGASPNGLRRLAELVSKTRPLRFEAGTDYADNARAVARLLAEHAVSEPNAGARISVIVAVRDGALYLGEALRSIFAQRRPAHEVIVVDDGSSDGSGELARSFVGVRCLRQEPLGQASALNAGVRASTGDFLAFLDADDRWLPNKLELQLRAFADDPALDIVFGRARQFLHGETTQSSSDAPPALPARLPSALLVRRQAWQRVGAFSTEWPLGGVIEWCSRADDRGLRSRMLPEVVYERRVHGKNSTLSHPNAAREYARMLKSVLDRRRRARESDPTDPSANVVQASSNGGGSA